MYGACPALVLPMLSASPSECQLVSKGSVATRSAKPMPPKALWGKSHCPWRPTPGYGRLGRLLGPGVQWGGERRHREPGSRKAVCQLEHQTGRYDRTV